MKNLIVTGLGLASLCLTFPTYAASFVTCNDSKGPIFAGLMENPSPEAGVFDHEMEVRFDRAISRKPVIVIDRQTFRRVTGIDMKDCTGPYARVFEKRSVGTIRCSSGEIGPLQNLQLDDQQGAGLALGMGASDAVCSAYLTKAELAKFPIRK